MYDDSCPTFLQFMTETLKSQSHNLSVHLFVCSRIYNFIQSRTLTHTQAHAHTSTRTHRHAQHNTTRSGPDANQMFSRCR